MCGLYRRMLDAAVPGERHACHVAGLSLAYSQAAIFIVTAIMVYFGGAEVSSGRTTFEHMLKAFMSIVFASMGVAQAMVSFPDIGKSGPAVQRMMRLLYPDACCPEASRSSSAGGKSDKVPELVLVTEADDDIDSRDHSELMMGRISNLQGRVELVHVWFSYPTRPDVRVLQDFSLYIPACKSFCQDACFMAECSLHVLKVSNSNACIYQSMLCTSESAVRRHSLKLCMPLFVTAVLHTPLLLQAPPSHWSVALAAASPPSSPSCSASTSPTQAQCCWMVSTYAAWT